jgi:hypothetical protein
MSKYNHKIKKYKIEHWKKFKKFTRSVSRAASRAVSHVSSGAQDAIRRTKAAAEKAARAAKDAADRAARAAKDAADRAAAETKKAAKFAAAMAVTMYNQSPTSVLVKAAIAGKMPDWKEFGNKLLESGKNMIPIDAIGKLARGEKLDPSDWLSIAAVVPVPGMGAVASVGGKIAKVVVKQVINQVKRELKTEFKKPQYKSNKNQNIYQNQKSSSTPILSSFSKIKSKSKSKSKFKSKSVRSIYAEPFSQKIKSPIIPPMPIIPTPVISADNLILIKNATEKYRDPTYEITKKDINNLKFQANELVRIEENNIKENIILKVEDKMMKEIPKVIIHDNNDKEKQIIAAQKLAQTEIRKITNDPYHKSQLNTDIAKSIMTYLTIMNLKLPPGTNFKNIIDNVSNVKIKEVEKTQMAIIKDNLDKIIIVKDPNISIPDQDTSKELKPKSNIFSIIFTILLIIIIIISSYFFYTKYIK